MIDHMILDGANALIIGGDEGHRLSLRRSLCRGGMSVQEASTGAEGLALARTQPDLIVVEVRLPDISGLDVTAALKADPLTQPIPVIQRSSAPIDDSAQVEVLTTGADAFLVEPIQEDMLIATAVALLRHSELSRQLELALSLDVTGVYDWNIATGDVRWSDSLERIHRLPPGGFGGTFEDFADHVHPEDRDRVRRELSEAAESADSIDMAFRFMRADRSFGWMESRGRVFRNRDGRAVRLLGLAHDVSSRMFERQRVDQLRRLASGLTSARTTSSVMETLGAELEGTNVSVQLVTDDTPAEADVSFSYEVSGGRLDLTRARRR